MNEKMEERIGQIFYPNKLTIIENKQYISDYSGYQVAVELLEKEEEIELTVYGEKLDGEELRERLVEEFKFLFADIFCKTMEESTSVLVPMTRSVDEIKEILDLITDFYRYNQFEVVLAPAIGTTEKTETTESAETTESKKTTYPNLNTPYYGETQADIKRNKILSIVVPIMGALPGIILWIIAGQGGYIQQVVAMMIVLGVFTGHALFSKKITWGNMLFVIFTIFFATYIANLLTYTFLVVNQMGVGFFKALFGVVFGIALVDELKISFWVDLLVSMFFEASGSLGLYIFYLKKRGRI